MRAKRKLVSRKKLRDISRMLTRYKKQLEARHATEPLKPPPVFLLNVSIMDLERLAAE